MPALNGWGCSSTGLAPSTEGATAPRRCEPITWGGFLMLGKLMQTVTEIIPSPYQQAIYEFIDSGKGSAVIEACAGSGKTSTLVECARRLTAFDNAVAIAFNRKIADELTRRLPPYCPAATLNSIGFRAWKAFTDKSMEVDKYKVSTLVRELSDDSNPDFRQGVKRLVDLAKMAGIVPSMVKTVTYPLAADTTDEWEGLIEQYGVTFGWGDKWDRAIELARRVLAESVRVGASVIDFNDQLYLPVVFGADFIQYDIVFCDELQDLSAIQFTMVGRSLAASGRFIGFGDRFQNIYSWRGSIDAMTLAKSKFDAVSLPLSISYRCAKAIIKAAKPYMPAIEAREDAPEGSVTEWPEWGVGDFSVTDVVLCRNNAPLVKMAFKLLRGGKACKVMGRDIGAGLAALVQRLKAGSIRELSDKLDKFLTKGRVESEGKPDQLAALLDKVATLRVFMENCSTPADVIGKITSLFADEQGQYLTLSTVFKFKGAEAPRIFILDFQLIGQRGDDETERCVAGVAITRAQNELVFIKS